MKGIRLQVRQFDRNSKLVLDMAWWVAGVAEAFGQSIDTTGVSSSIHLCKTALRFMQKPNPFGNVRHGRNYAPQTVSFLFCPVITHLKWALRFSKSSSAGEQGEILLTIIILILLQILLLLLLSLLLYYYTTTTTATTTTTTTTTNDNNNTNDSTTTNNNDNPKR